MKQTKMFLAATLMFVFMGYVATSCSNDDVQENTEVQGQETVLTRNVEVNVSTDSIKPAQIGPQTRVSVEFPDGGKGRMSYNYTQDDVLHIFTKVNGKYVDNVLKVKYGGGSSATFEGKIQYTESNKKGYAFVGDYKELRGNLLYLGKSDELNQVIIGKTVTQNNGIFQYGETSDVTAKGFYLYMDMLTSFATVKVESDFLSQLSPTDNIVLSCSSIASPKDSVGFMSGNIYLNLETGQMVSDSYTNSNSFYYRVGDLNLTFEDIISVTILPGYYVNFTVFTDLYTGNGEKKWQSRSARFSNVRDSYGWLSKGQWTFLNYSSNKNFYFGSIGKDTGGKGVYLPESGETVDFSKDSK